MKIMTPTAGWFSLKNPKHVVLVWPESTFLVEEMYYPPLGLWYVWAALHKVGRYAQYLDMAEDAGPLVKALHRPSTEVWVSGTTPQVATLRRLGDYIRNMGRKAVLGGPHAWIHGEEMLEHYDLVVQGEVFEGWQAQMVLEAGEGVLPIPTSKNLARVGPPCRIAAERYSAKLQGKRCTTMITSLGCPYKCAYCSSQDLWGKRVRYFSLEAIRQDIEAIANQGWGAVQIYDDILPIKPQRTLEIAAHLKYYGLSWRCFMRSDLGVLHGKSFLTHLRNMGLVEVLVGVESSSQVIKDNVHKGTTVEQDTLLREWCKDLGIAFKASIILGLPGETMETMEATRQWLIENRPDKADVNMLIPMPGTPLYGGEYDCQWTCAVPDEFFFKGRPGELTCLVETDALSSEEILAFRNRLVEELAIPY